MKRTIYKYIGQELWPTFAASLFAAVFVILATKMLSITELIVTHGVRASQVGRMVVYLLPDILAFALPAASLMAVVVGFLRLSADNEIIALKSCGISLYQTLPPVVALSLLGMVLGLLISIAAVPWGNRSFKELLFQIAESKADLGIKERVFSEPFDGVVFYVNSFSARDRIMRDLFVVDRRDPALTHTIVAGEGRIYRHSKERAITLRFRDGTVFVSAAGQGKDRTIRFDTYDLNVGLQDILKALAGRKRAPKEMTVRELVAGLRSAESGREKYNQTVIELMERFAIPLAVLLMGIAGVPLGSQLRTAGRTAGVGVSLLVFLAYYLCLAAARSVCETGAVPPALGVWIPDLLLAVICIYLLRRVAREQAVFNLSWRPFRTR